MEIALRVLLFCFFLLVIVISCWVEHGTRQVESLGKKNKWGASTVAFFFPVFFVVSFFFCLILGRRGKNVIA